jgi:thiamine biosynthesis protein ThiS
MKVLINGESFSSKADQLDLLLQQWGAQSPFVVALNKTFIPKHQHTDTRVKSGDIIDVVVPVAGG